jgi:predicted nucleic acid-binding protein
LNNLPWVLIDTNVILDLLLERAAFVNEAQRLNDRVEAGTCRAMLCATTVTTIDYLARKQLGSAAARGAVSALLSLYDIAAVTRATLHQALASDMPDFEDAVLAYSAYQSGAQAIITRNLRDFAKSPVRAYTPAQFLALQAL